MNPDASSSNWVFKSSEVKSFVSESQIEERRQKRQEEWEKNRKPDDPLEAPEEVYDSRSLYDQLKEQRVKKDEEYEESKKLKNMIKTLDNDEVSFLEMVDTHKMEYESKIWQEEMKEIEQYKKALASLPSEEQEKRLDTFKKEVLVAKSKRKSDDASGSNGNSNKKSQMALLANVIRKRTSSSSSSQDSNKKMKTIVTEDNEKKDEEEVKKESEVKKVGPISSTIKCIGVLPGLNYSDSSDSDDSSHGIDDFNLIIRKERISSCVKKEDSGVK